MITEPEVLFGYALAACEPPKVEGGSKERQDWLTLVLEIQVYLHEHDMDVNSFRDQLLDSSDVTKTVISYAENDPRASWNLPK